MKKSCYFQERIEKHREEIEELEALEKTVDIPIPPSVIWTPSTPLEIPVVPQRPEGSIYYEQVCTTRDDNIKAA